MSQTFTAVFDGDVLRPDSPLNLRPNNRYFVIAEEIPEKTADNGDAWDLLAALAGSVQAPEDWAAEHDHYLYGTPKHKDDSPT